MDDINLIELYKNKEYKKFIINYLLLKEFEIEDLKLYMVSHKKDIKDTEYSHVIVRGFDCYFIIEGKKEGITIKSHKLHKCFKKLMKAGETYLFDPKSKYVNKEIIKYL
jgi:hypothetical protein